MPRLQQGMGDGLTREPRKAASCAASGSYARLHSEKGGGGFGSREIRSFHARGNSACEAGGTKGGTSMERKAPPQHSSLWNCLMACAADNLLIPHYSSLLIVSPSGHFAILNMQFIAHSSRFYSRNINSNKHEQQSRLPV
jgi:hypothetical protein